MEIPIVDLQGKELGKLVLTEEVDEVLKGTGVNLMVSYNSKKQEVIGYLH